MILELLDTEDFEDLPDDHGARWVVLEKLARERLGHALVQTESGRNEKSLKLQYMHVVNAAADNLGVQGISIPGGSDAASQLDVFMIHAQAAATKILLDSGETHSVFGFRVRDDAKSRIRFLLAEIHNLISNLKLSEAREKRLRSALRQFSVELDTPKSRYTVGATHLVAALTVLNLAVTTTASGPDALSSIQQIQTIWGEEHERSMSEKLHLDYDAPVGLLEPPPKQITGPKK